MSDGTERFRKLLEQQLEMNPKTWAALEARGVDARTPLVIDFAYTAPSKEAADRLVEILRERTSFDCEPRSEGARFKRVWRVFGQTRPSRASIEMLNDWVTFMVTIGARHGECRFDGWGVRLPGPKAEQAEPAPDVQDLLAPRLDPWSSNGHTLP